jgi:hypothetical protein
MELDDLKYIWKSREPGFQPKDEYEIAQMLKGRSKSIVEKLMRSVWLELAFTFVAGLGLLIYALLMPSGALKWTASAILIVLVAYTIYYIKKLILLKRFNPAADNLRDTLEALVASLSSYLNFYKRSYTILYPVYFLLGLLFSLLERGANEFVEALSRPRTIIILSLVAGIFYITSTWAVRWLLRKLYGNHLDKLKALVNDLHS